MKLNLLLTFKIINFLTSFYIIVAKLVPMMINMIKHSVTA